MILRCLKCMARCVSVLVVVLIVQGCRGSNPVYDTLTNVLPWSRQYASLQPGFEYLWVSVDGRASVMALGSRETRGRAVHEHWYTGQGEMIYLVNGRVQQALGFTHEVRHQTGQAPAWSELGQSLTAVQWTRQLDLMPGYRMGVQEYVASRAVAEPSRLPEDVPAHAQWYADIVNGKHANGLAWRYEQRFALANDHVVYSEQCLAATLCLKLRPLGVVVP
jgi:hypothetical protein